MYVHSSDHTINCSIKHQTLVLSTPFATSGRGAPKMPALAPPAIRADSGSGVPPAAARHPGDADLAAPGIWLCSGGQLPDGLWAAVCGRAPSPGLRADPVPADPGFCQGGVLDALRPGPELALLLPGAGDLPGLGDEEPTRASALCCVNVNAAPTSA